MYSVSSVSLQNIYANSAAAKSYSKKGESAAAGTVLAPSAAEKYAQTDGTAVIAENFYATLVERTKTSDEEMDGRVDNDTVAERIIANLAAAGILKSEEDDEEEEEEAVDELLKAVRAHQKTLKEEKIGRKKSGLTVEEVKEILSELNCVNSMTVK